MKNFILPALLLFSFHTFGQKKAEIEELSFAVDSLTKVSTTQAAQLDSLTKVVGQLSATLDSTSSGLATYYSVIKDKVLMHDFDPAQFSQIVDSLKASNSEKLTGLTNSSTALNDSITVLTAENKSLRDTIAKLETASLDKEKLIGELKQLKELLDAGILTQEEYDDKKSVLMAKWD